MAYPKSLFRKAVILGTSIRCSNHIAAVCLLALCVVAPLHLAANDDRLRTNSPFLPPGFNDPKPETAPPPVPSAGPLAREIEFRGIAKFDGTYQFSIFNKKEQKSYWIKENDSESGISVRAFDAQRSTVTVSMDGRTERLTLADATDSPLAIPASQPSPAQSRVAPAAQEGDDAERRRVIPRRRVILPRN